VNSGTASAYVFHFALAVELLAGSVCASGQSPSPWVTDCSGVPNSTLRNVTWTPTLCQEFSGAQGAPDTSAWSFDLGGGGWGNNEQETYCGPPGYAGNPAGCPATFDAATANAYQDGIGHLVIQVIQSAGTWYSARLKTEGVQNFAYGRVEASIKLPDTENPGLWPAFWWLGRSFPSVPWPACGEVDIMEDWSPAVFNGPGPAGNQSTIHTALTGGDGISGSYTFPNGERADTEFYAYGVIWSANMLQFYVNPTTPTPASIQPFFIITASDLSANDTWPFNAGAFLITNVAVGGTLGGSTVNTRSPDRMLIDYIRSYQATRVPTPNLGQPPPITMSAGATTGNTSTFTPGLYAGTGYVYFSCDTTGPGLNCSIATDDPLNTFVVNSDAPSPESVTVTVTTAGNAGSLPVFFKRKGARPFLLAVVLGTLLAVIACTLARTFARRVPAGIAYSGLVLAAVLIMNCGGCGGVSMSSSGTTPPTTYTVNVYAFTESNTSDGENSTADATVAIPVTVN
jgi:beta-glucanase (GH16 family)